MIKRVYSVALLAACLAAHFRAPAQAPGPSYDAATIRPSDPSEIGQSWHGVNNRITLGNVTLRQLIKVAYGLRSDSQVIGGPDWIAKAHFDINAKMDDEEFARMHAMSGKEEEAESQLLLRNLLADRFHLRVQADTRPLPQFALIVDGGGAKLAPSRGDSAGQNFSSHNGHLVAKAVPMESLAGFLADTPEVNGRVVVDRTELPGAYNFELNWVPDRGSGVPSDATLPGLFTALREQLGLKLARGEGAVPVVVVTGAELPQFD